MNDVNTMTPAAELGWWDQLKAKFDGDWLKQFDFSTQSLIEIATYCGIGFLLGFLVKRYGRVVVTIMISLAVIFGILSYLQIISIDWVQIRSLMGIDESASLDTLFQTIVTWIKDHVKIVVSALFGFFVGYKAG